MTYLDNHFDGSSKTAQEYWQIFIFDILNHSLPQSLSAAAMFRNSIGQTFSSIFSKVLGSSFDFTENY